ncbi:unnamed protein product [Caenorhabditis brenneri]
MDYLINNITHLPSSQADRVYSLLFSHFDKERAVVHTDGSCKYNGTEEAKAGYGVFWGNDHPYNFQGKVHGLQDSSRAELNGADQAIRQAIDQGYHAITIASDSNFVKMVIEKPHAFRGSTHADFHDLMGSIHSMKEHIKVDVEYIKAHVGNYGNEMADTLAKRAVSMESFETIIRYRRKRKVPPNGVEIPSVSVKVKDSDTKKRDHQRKKPKKTSKNQQQKSKTVPVELPPNLKTLIRTLSATSLAGGVRKRNSLVTTGAKKTRRNRQKQPVKSA